MIGKFKLNDKALILFGLLALVGGSMIFFVVADTVPIDVFPRPPITPTNPNGILSSCHLSEDPMTCLFDYLMECYGTPGSPGDLDAEPEFPEAIPENFCSPWTVLLENEELRELAFLCNHGNNPAACVACSRALNEAYCFECTAGDHSGSGICGEHGLEFEYIFDYTCAAHSNNTDGSGTVEWLFKGTCAPWHSPDNPIVPVVP